MASGIDSESDGIEEALEGSVRIAVMVGARVGSEVARAREERLREQRRTDEREAERLVQRLEAEKLAAVAELSQVHRTDWWERADAKRIGQTYATARAWAPEADEAVRAEQKMREELQQRFGIDLNRLDPGAVSAEVEVWRRQLEQRPQETERSRAAETTERAEAAVLLDQAAREDRDRQQGRDRDGFGEDQLGSNITGEAERLYDSADRRAADRLAMEANAIAPEVAQTRMQADLFRAQPATTATIGAHRGRAPKARKATSPGAQNERAGIER